jgi:hypothetical protein
MTRSNEQKPYNIQEELSYSTRNLYFGVVSEWWWSLEKTPVCSIFYFSECTVNTYRHDVQAGTQTNSVVLLGTRKQI